MMSACLSVNRARPRQLDNLHVVTLITDDGAVDVADATVVVDNDDDAGLSLNAADSNTLLDDNNDACSATCCSCSTACCFVVTGMVFARPLR